MNSDVTSDRAVVVRDQVAIMEGSPYSLAWSLSMPLTLPALSRRHFLASTLAATWTASQLYAAEPAADAQRFVLFSDTHIAAKPEVSANGINMHAHFTQAVKDMLALQHKPAAALWLGDCAYLEGQAADYTLLLETSQPLREAGWPLHITLGNHDHRQRFWKALPVDQGQDKFVDARHIMVIPTPVANWFLLDTLDITNSAPGTLGKEQLLWLAKALDEHADKPALIAMHHNPDFNVKPGGLLDTAQLFEVLTPRKQVKAVFFGHTHVWNVETKNGIHLINLPPVAYVFAKGKPSGFIEAQLRAEGAKLTLSAIDKAHPTHGEQVDLKWR